jgi:hypothetical protein
MQPNWSILARVVGAVALVALTWSKAASDLSCSFKDKTSTAVVKNNNTFQKTCAFECIYSLDVGEHINKGKAGLNAGQSFTQPGEAKMPIKAFKSKTTDCEK